MVRLRLTPDYALERMAVLRRFQSAGVGALLLTALEQRAQALAGGQLDTVTVPHAWKPAVPFYLKHNYIVDGPEFQRADQPHLPLVKRFIRPPRRSFDVLVGPATGSLYSDCIAIRRTVFVDEQGFTIDEEVRGRSSRARCDREQPDEHDDASIHFLAVDRTTREPAGAARYRVDANKLGRLAVLKPFRGSGLGGELVRAVERYASDVARVDSLKLEAQVRVMPFYSALSYLAEGAEFDDGGVPHRLMRKTLSKRRGT